MRRRILRRRARRSSSQSATPLPACRNTSGVRRERFQRSLRGRNCSLPKGFAAIAYDAIEPAVDLSSLLAFLQTDGARLGIDPGRLGVLACSGNAPVALAALATGGLRCAILLYAFTLDAADGSTVEAAARRFGFANASAQLVIDDLPQTTPLMVVRAGQDAFPGLNATLDRFAADALRRNLPITVINHAEASHAFDLLDDSRESHRVIRHVLAFARFQLLE